MRNGKLFFSAVEFLMIVALFCLGALFFGLHFLPSARFALSDWILYSSSDFLFIGGLIVGIALALTLSLWAIHRRKFVRIEMEKHPVSLDQQLIKQTVEQFWKEAFPEEKLPSDVYVSKQKIEVISTLPKVELEEIEGRLGQLLKQQLGYGEKFYLSVTGSSSELRNLD